MTERKAPMLFHKALQRAIGPLDAEHLAGVIIVSTSDDVDIALEQMEHEFLLFLIIHEINSMEPDDRSFANIEQRINPDDVSSLEPILKHTESWKKGAKNQGRELAAAGVKDRLLQVLLADDPDFIVSGSA